MGILLIDKPKGITSHDVIYKLRKITGIKKIGHAGTLDPNASGLLIVAITREFTKKLGDLSKKTKKQYIAELTLGEERDTHDIEGKVTNTSNNVPDIHTIKNILSNFEGKISQIPPKHSAIKINGKKAYDLARSSKEFELKPREVTIYTIKIIDFTYPILKLEIDCSSGTYIRALARDIGRDIGSFAYLSNLRRTMIGDYSVSNAHKLDTINADNWQDKEV